MKPSIEKFEKHKINPFLLEAFSHIRQKRLRKHNGEIEAVNKSTGEVFDMALKGAGALVFTDSQSFIKFFGQSFLDIIDLSKPAQNVIKYFLLNLKQDSDLVEFNLKTVKEFCKYDSSQPVYNGLAELIEQKFIARTELHYKYFINPTMFFNGDRQRIMNELKKRAKFGELPNGSDE